MDTDQNTSLMDQKEDIDMVEAEANLDDVFMTDPQDQTIVIADLLKWTYALSMRLIVSDVTKNFCQGCVCDHPSQLEHDVCVIMPFEEQVDNWFNEILEAVDENYIIRKWLGYLGQLNPTVQYHEMSKYLNPEY